MPFASSIADLRFRPLLLLTLLAGVWRLVIPHAAAQTAVTITPLHSFNAGSEGGSTGRLVQGSDGNFYGANNVGGTSGNGTIIKVTPAGVVTTLHTFGAYTDYTAFGDGINADGGSPGAIAAGSDGNFYGTTGAGGPSGSGTFYRITPAGGFTVLHNFDARTSSGNNTEGFRSGDLLAGGDGNFYSTNYFGGANGNGTFFRVSVAGAVTVLHTFSASAATGNDQDNTEGANPQSLVAGSDGSFYGTTYGGGSTGNGTFYRITPAGALTTLHVFGAGDAGTSPSGASPASRLTQGSDGNFYGVTLAGGSAGQGTVYRITPAGTLTTLHSFTDTDENGLNADGNTASNGLTRGSDGNLYGTTSAGGSGGSGVVYGITSTGDFNVLYDFSALGTSLDHPGTNADGAFPGNLTSGSDGNLYGTASSGGANGGGTIFKFAPSLAVSSFFAGETALSNGVYYLTFPNGNFFGYYAYLTDRHYIYHFDLGYEYVFDANDGHAGVYLYDFQSGGFFYTSPGFPFPYLYDFTLQTVLYYYPDPNNNGRYNTDGYRFFYRFDNGQTIVK